MNSSYTDTSRRELIEIEDAFADYMKHNTITKCRIGVAQLRRFIQKYKLKVLDEQTVLKLIQLAIKCGSIFHYRIDILGNRLSKQRTSAEAKVALNLFKTVMVTLYSSHSEEVMPSFIKTLDSNNYFCFTTYAELLFKSVLSVTVPNTEVVDAVLDKIEQYAVHAVECDRSLNILRWLSSAVSSQNWPHSDVSILLRLLHMHNRSIFAFEENSSYFSLLAGLRICLKASLMKATLEGVDEVIKYQLIVLLECESTGEIIDFLAYPLLYGSFLYKVETFSTSLHPSLVRNILMLIASPDKRKSVFGNQIFQNIFDTRRNLVELFSVRIFFLELTRYNINVQKPDAIDEAFIRAFRKEMHVSFLTAIIYHADERSILKHVYTSMALLITEIPCSFTAAFLVCLVMQVQNTFQEQEIPLAASHRVHALVIAIMSLVCWIMNAEVLYKYVNTILKRRANMAPFLNPPLRDSYKYANHYVLWNKAEYFFESYEVRYALWKRFRLPEGESESKQKKLQSFVL